MRYVRYAHGDVQYWGMLLTDDLIQPLTAAPYLRGVPLGQPVPLKAVRLLAPCEPGKIVAIGKNYRDHIEEFDSAVPETPIIFIKPSTSVNDPGSPIILPPPEISRQVDYECELAAVISRTAFHVSAAEAKDYILGYTCLNDVTARDIQARDGQWIRAKGFDGFAPIGPLVTDEVDPGHLTIRTRLNGKVKQESSTANQIWPISELIAFITTCMTLLPGDVVSTGTPAGVGPMQDGDDVIVSIEGIGALHNPVRAAR
ncbi:MAG: fumarylacetoacetate hydrolase family protein [Ruminococcaceae bacterium]|jgi:2-keto-4-pentenoate hydratase/2-oxohepta-3-ene-1,7-dioic acid hydratase in catechol pathway|nr:fumarylacetoacetate hydrolase family protein [Oscillospiraceae bacterium]